MVQKAKVLNPWFTEDNVKDSFREWGQALTLENLENWLEPYADNIKDCNKAVGIVMAGNIPLVGFHDLLSVILSGNRAVVKMSSSDNLLMGKIIQLLQHFSPDMKELIKVVPKLTEIEAIIATGSNNTSRYFDYYFGKYPCIIRKNRNSVAVITGDESSDELKGLGRDIFQYFGLGCRSVAKLYVPKGYDLDNIFGAIFSYKDIVNHNKYANNFDYNKALYMMNQDDLLENGFILFKKDKTLTSPIATMFYEEYEDLEMLKKELAEKESEIQCIVSKEDVPFGKSQSPHLWDYADGIDTMEFLVNL